MPRQNLADFSAMRRTTVNKLEFREARSRENHVLPKAKLGYMHPDQDRVSSIRPVWSKLFFISYFLTGGNDTSGKFTLPVLLQSKKILEKN
jgi:hypothetical protein